MQNQDPNVRKESNKALFITGIILVIFVSALVTNGYGLFDKKPVINNSTFIELGIGKAPVLGDINAPVTIYEFSDFSCPYCAAAVGYNDQMIAQLKAQDKNWQPPIKGIEDKYINNGKVKIVFKYSPSHGTGQPAQLIGWCLNDQNLFWEFHDLAFKNQEKTNDMQEMKNIAKSLGANMSQIEDCLNSLKYNYLLDEDYLMGVSNGVDGTPSFIINGKLVSGAVSFAEIDKIIQEELQ